MTRILQFAKNIFQVNPIVVKEIRSRMRGPRAFITLTLILLAMGGAMYGMLQLILAGSRYTTVMSPQIGQGLFAALAFLMLSMVCAVTPAVTAGAISSEKEKQTYEMLMSTPLSPTSILWGKLISALSYIFLLLFAGVPLASVVFIFGGVAPRDMLKALMILLVFAVSFGILGLFMSALFGRTGRATVASFIVVALLMIAPIFAAALIGVIYGREPPRWILAPSPISALSSAISQNTAMGSDIFSVLGGFFSTGINPISQTSIPRPMYHYTLPFYTVLSLVLYMLSTRLVQPTRRFRMHWKQWLIGLLTVVLVVGVIAVAFFATARRYEWAVNPINPGMQTMPVNMLNGPMIQQKEVFVQAQAAAAAASQPADPVETPPPTFTPAPAMPPVKSTPGDAEIGATPAANAPLISLSDEAQAEVYALVARQLYSVDHTFGKNLSPNWPVLYIHTHTDDGVGDPNAQKGESVTLSDAITSSITKRLKDLPTEIKWINSADEAPLEKGTGTVAGGNGAIITLGNIQPQADGTVHISASLYFGAVGATGKTYILEKVNGTWTITGSTGVEWIS